MLGARPGASCRSGTPSSCPAPPALPCCVSVTLPCARWPPVGHQHACHTRPLQTTLLRATLGGHHPIWHPSVPPHPCPAHPPRTVPTLGHPTHPRSPLCHELAPQGTPPAPSARGFGTPQGRRCRTGDTLSLGSGQAAAVSPRAGRAPRPAGQPRAAPRVPGWAGRSLGRGHAAFSPVYSETGARRLPVGHEPGAEAGGPGGQRRRRGRPQERWSRGATATGLRTEPRARGAGGGGTALPSISKGSSFPKSGVR